MSGFLIASRLHVQFLGISHVWSWRIGFVSSVKLRTNNKFFQTRIVVVLKTMVCVCGTVAFQISGSVNVWLKVVARTCGRSIIIGLVKCMRTMDLKDYVWRERCGTKCCGERRFGQFHYR